MSLIDKDNFVGKYKLSKNEFTDPLLQLYVDRYEVKILTLLFGKELYDLWVLGLIATDPIYEFLRDPFSVEIGSERLLFSRGVEDMLTGFIYLYLVRDGFVQQTPNGPVLAESANSEKAGVFTAQAQGRWNEAVETHEDIQDYILENSAIYPEYNGTREELMLPF